MTHSIRARIGLAIVSAALAGAASEVSRVHAADMDLRGSWKSEVYTLKDGTRHVMPGLLIFTKTDWTTLWVITVDGKAVRGAGEGGTYTVAGNRLTFRHHFNVSGGAAVKGMAESPLRIEANKPESAPTEPCTVSLDGDRLIVHFPSGNQIAFRRSSVF
jgi:hypothetical protein